MKKDCAKFKKWLENNGNSISCVCYEFNMVDVNHNTWRIDFGSTIHISNTLKGVHWVSIQNHIRLHIRKI